MSPRIFDRTGISGLDEVLKGGLPAGHLYLVEGEPGTGKTTLALSFLVNGPSEPTKTLYVTLSETADELKKVANSHGWSLDSIEIMEIERDFARHAPENQYTVFDSKEAELRDTVEAIYATVKRISPERVVIDSLSELRLLTQDSLLFRRELLALKRYFSDSGTTVLILDDLTIKRDEGIVHSIAHGVIRLERVLTDYGVERRRLLVPKLRGSRFREGYHDYRVNTGGLEVFPRLVASEHRPAREQGQISLKIKNFDQLLGGGLDRGTSTIFLGPSGAGKSTLGTLFSVSAASKGEKVAIFLFDENLGTYLERNEGLNLGLSTYLESGEIQLRQIDPSEVSPGELIHFIRSAVEDFGARHIVIDSINGMVQAMPGEKTLLIQIHELLTYLGQKSVTTVLTLAQHGVMGPSMSSLELSYLADTLVTLRFFEASGELRQAIAVVKKRTGSHERGIHEIQFSDGGLQVGKPLRDFQGVFTGVPHFSGKESELFRADRG